MATNQTSNHLPNNDDLFIVLYWDGKQRDQDRNGWQDNIGLQTRG